MIELLVGAVIALGVIAAAAVLGPRLGIAAPLVLVAIGVAASFLPALGSADIEPEWILEGVLPPLLYSSAVSMPAMNFRREFGAISGLSVLLVVGSALALGVFFMLVIPGIGFAWGVALGAVVSPTDAVATSIIKQTPVSKRVVAMLDGESLLNDATALVILRTAIVATASSFSFLGAVGSFAYSVVVAVLVGAAVGWLNLVVRRRVTDPAVNTVIGFTVPFVASVPAGSLKASGLVAAVVAGLITGIRAPRVLSAQNRLSDAQNWRTVELVLEGAVFLTMGVQIKTIIEDVESDHAGVGPAVLVAAGALALTVLVRAAYVTPLLGFLAARVRHGEGMKPRLEDMQANLVTPEGRQEMFEEVSSRRRPASERELAWFARRITRGLANVEYFLREPLGWREGTAVVWAGMRGAVTVAAAQTLRRITPEVDRAVTDARTSEEVTRLFRLLKASADTVPEPPAPEGEPSRETFESARGHRLAVLPAQRAALLDARDNGTFDADVLAGALANLDASQIDLEMRGRLVS